MEQGLIHHFLGEGRNVITTRSWISYLRGQSHSTSPFAFIQSLLLLLSRYTYIQIDRQIDS